MDAIDPKTFWKAMGARPLGVPVVAARGSDGPAGLLALSVSHVTASPPSMLVSVGHSTGAHAAIKASGAFAISYLPEGAEDVAEIFGGRRGLSGAARFDASQWTSGATGSPIFAAGTAYFDCTISSIFTYEDTDIIVGRIESFAADAAAAPLVTFGGGYRRLLPA
ncbi:flavin reductase family protein [Mesorhizobium sp. CAU 1741]|uniref:flavin reductase family protein n=1 Tax=Mesorhizobium sp. CAU 1741 TaxID=3140366 RepID=UPI00325AD2F5